jgi:hypothetical protein
MTADGQSPAITNPVPGVSKYIGELVSKSKVAKDYYMYSTDEAAGRTFEERTKNLAKHIVPLLKEFADLRKGHYRAAAMTFKGSDWATGKHTSKTEVIAADTYTFTSIDRTTNGDWKGGPEIAGIDRSGWSSGDIPGGSVTWITGGHHHADTYWVITAKYAESFIERAVQSELEEAKKELYELKIPTEL